jgi:uncharacterized membrane protein
MAGIGFRLRALSEQDNLLAPVASIGHSTMIAAGPWLFTVTALGLISALADGFTPAPVVDGFRIVVIYSFAVSLVVTSPIVLVATRMAGDAIFTREFGRIQPLFFAGLLGAAAATSVVSLALYGALFSLPPTTVIAASSCTTLVGMIWVALAFCGAVHDYKGITLAFLVGLGIAVGTTLAAVKLASGWDGMIWAFNAGLIVVLAGLTSRVLATFPDPTADIADAMDDLLAGMLRHRALAVSGLVGALAIWIDKWVMWHAPERIVHELGLVHMPLYDSAMFTAYLTVIPAMALFVTHVETTFLDCYRRYYSAIRNHATLLQIEGLGEELKRVVLTSLGRITGIQAALCLAVVMGAPAIVQATGLWFQQVGILRLGAVGALFQFLFFAATALLLFFDRPGRFLALQTTFLVLQSGLAYLTLELGQPYYGYGHLAACVICAALALAVLERTMEDLTYITFVLANARSRQSESPRFMKRLLQPTRLRASSDGASR